MKKLLIFIIVIVGLLFIGIRVVKSKFNVETESTALPVEVYENDDLPTYMQSKLISIVNPTSTEDDYSLMEDFFNAMLLDSIKTNLNESYDPLSECDTDSCQHIVTNTYGYVEYAFVDLNSDNQLVLTISLGRDAYPDIETAIYMIFDVDISLVEQEAVLTLNQMFINETEITKNQLDRVFNYLNKEEIEAMISEGELDLDTYTYSVPLIQE